MLRIASYRVLLDFLNENRENWRNKKEKLLRNIPTHEGMIFTYLQTCKLCPKYHVPWPTTSPAKSLIQHSGT